MAVSAKKRRDDRSRHNRVRKTLRGTAQRPHRRRSNKHISAQVIDDIAGVTLASASTTESALRGDVNSNIEAATKAGVLLAERAGRLVSKRSCSTAVFPLPRPGRGTRRRRREEDWF